MKDPLRLDRGGASTLPSPATVFALLRHGTTVWNKEQRIQGIGDSPLTEAGRETTLSWSEHLNTFPWDIILASDLGRVRETVSILNDLLKLPVFFDKRLREQYWGKWEGMQLDSIKREEAESLKQQIQAGWDFKPPQGESRRAVLQRVMQVVEEARNRWKEKKILMVCHQGVIKCLLYHLAGRSFLPEEPKLIEKDRLHTFFCHNEVCTILQLNITLHSK